MKSNLIKESFERILSKSIAELDKIIIQCKDFPEDQIVYQNFIQELNMIPN
jgi:predicted Zn-dependent protease with MMP-like domain